VLGIIGTVLFFTLIAAACNSGAATCTTTTY